MFKKIILPFSLLFSASIFTSTVVASTDQIMKRLSLLVADPQSAVIEKTAVPSLYQVSVEGQVIYMSEDGRYFFQGSLIDLKTRDNLTKLAKAKITKKLMSSADPKSMIRYPAVGKTKHVISVFSDIDCPYCAKLHKEIPALNAAGVEVRYLSFPRSGLNTPSYHKAVSVWCSATPGKTMDLAMARKSFETKTCENPIKTHMILAQKIGVNGTPNIVLESGEVLPGYVPAKELIKMLNKQ